MMTPRENFLAALNHQPHDWTPSYLADVCSAGFAALPGPWIDRGPLGGGYDGFGVRWIAPASGSGASIPAPNEFILDDVTKWRDIVKFPNLDDFDWAGDADQFVGGADRTQQVVDFGMGNGPFERMATLMGFENTLLALVEEPEASLALLNAITDYRIKFAERVAEFYKPDIITNYDDIASERSPFMSPKTYRELIKPCHARFYKALRDMGIIAVQHTCGKAEMFIEDFIEIGAQAWSSVQPTNDIVGLLKKYGDKITLVGGYDSNGRPGQVLDEEVIRSEVRRCIDIYGKFDSYIFFGFVLVNTLDMADVMPYFMPMIQESAEYARKVAGK